VQVLFLSRSLEYGGTERQLVLLAKELHKRGHRVAVATLYDRGALSQELSEAGVSLYSLSKRSRWDVTMFFVRLVSLVRELKPEILYTFLPTQNLLGVVMKLLARDARLVWAVRASNVDLTQYDTFTGITYRLERWLSWVPELVIANSHAGAEYAASMGFRRSKMQVVPNGIDATEFTPDAVVRAELRREWGIADHEKLIGLIGRLDPMKDHRNFLRAAATVIRQRADVRVVCVGDGPPRYRKELMAEAESLGLGSRILWVEALQNPSRAYNALDLMVSASAWGEGFPNVVGEAMACGVPCVVTDVGDSALIVGPLGTVVPPRNHAALAEGILAALSNGSVPAEALRSRIVNEFSIEALVTRTEATLLLTCRE
jgi:glycosyltransferase involved in cell wall biosynthesis